MEKDVATHSSIFAWKIPRTEEPCGLQFTGSQRVGYDSSDLARVKINNVVTVSGGQKGPQSHMYTKGLSHHVHVSILPQTPSIQLPHGTEQGPLCWTLLVLHFKYSSVSMPIPNSLTIPSP